MAMPKKTRIWSEIKVDLPYIKKSGLNSVEILLWSQDKGLEEVRKRMREIKQMVEKEEEEKKNSKKKHKSDEYNMEELDDEDNIEEVHEEILLDLQLVDSDQNKYIIFTWT